jgi:hypothetical protein
MTNKNGTTATTVRLIFLVAILIPGLSLISDGLNNAQSFDTLYDNNGALDEPTTKPLMFRPTILPPVRSKNNSVSDNSVSDMSVSDMQSAVVESYQNTSIESPLRHVIISANNSQEISHTTSTKPLADPAAVDTSIVITSSLIPTHPSVRMINDTIHSVYRHLIGLHSQSPLFIMVDGIKPGASNEDRIRFAQMISNLEGNFTHSTVIYPTERKGLTRMFKQAVEDTVQTPFMYILQHDLMFISDIKHTAMVKTMKEYPDLLRVVRFNKYRNVRKRGDQGHVCFGEESILNNVNGLQFTKTGMWSDK